MTSRIRQSVLFPDLLSKPLQVIFDEPSTTSDGGAMLLKAVDRRLNLTEVIANCILDMRQEAKVKHTWLEMFTQRTFGLALGYFDANDAGRLGGDPMMRMLIGRDPSTGAEPSLAVDDIPIIPHRTPVTGRVRPQPTRRGDFWFVCPGKTPIQRPQAPDQTTLRACAAEIPNLPPQSASGLLFMNNAG